MFYALTRSHLVSRICTESGTVANLSVCQMERFRYLPDVIRFHEVKEGQCQSFGLGPRKNTWLWLWCFGIGIACRSTLKPKILAPLRKELGRRWQTTEVALLYPNFDPGAGATSASTGLRFGLEADGSHGKV